MLKEFLRKLLPQFLKHRMRRFINNSNALKVITGVDLQKQRELEIKKAREANLRKEHEDIIDILSSQILINMRGRFSKRVLMVVANRVRGDSRVIKSAESLSNKGFGVLIVGIDNSEDVTLLRSVCSVPVLLVGTKSHDIDQNIDRFVAEVANLMAPLIKKFEPTHVYSHDFLGLAFTSESLAELNKSRYCHWTHDVHEYVPGLTGAISLTRQEWATQIEKDRFAVPDQVVFVNEKIRDLCLPFLSPHQRVDVLHNTPRGNRASTLDIREACGLREDEFLTVYVGRATELRGLLLVLDALVELQAMRFALLSDGPKNFLTTFEKRATEMGVRDRIHIFGYVDDREVISAISGADIGLVPFTRYGNTDIALATKIFEYIHAGLPLVVSDCRLQAELVEEYQLGEIFDASDATSFISAIRRVVDKGAQLYKKNHPQLKSRFSWEKSFNPITEYLRLTHEAGPALNVFQGPGPSAGQPYAIAKGLRAKEVDAISVSVSADAIFKYNSHVNFPLKKMSDTKNFIFWAAQRFDIFHFHFRSIYFYLRKGSSWNRSKLADLYLLKSMGKKIVFTFRGSEARINSIFSRLNPYAWEEGADPFKLGDSEKREIIELVKSLADKVFVVDPELQTYIPEADILPRSVDLDYIDRLVRNTNRKLEGCGNPQRTRPIKIAHAPSRREVKGTEELLSAIQALKQEGTSIELDIIENVDHTEALARIAAADIIVDQLLIGWYGVVSIEAMALGKLCMAYIRKDLIESLEPDCPIVPIDRHTLLDELKKWIGNAEERATRASAGRQFIERYHSQDVIAEQLVSCYSNLACRP